MPISGGCLCKQLRYEIAADAPIVARVCWCRVCQYLGCGTGAVGALFRKEDVAVSGPLWMPKIFVHCCWPMVVKSMAKLPSFRLCWLLSGLT